MSQSRPSSRLWVLAILAIVSVFAGGVGVGRWLAPPGPAEVALSQRTALAPAAPTAIPRAIAPRPTSTPVPVAPAAPNPKNPEDLPVAPEVGARAPDFKLKDLDGEEVSLSGLRGQAVLLNFWASW